jgi:hypothetical protein
MSDLLTVRASALPLAFRCAGSLRPDPNEVRINPSHDAANDGTAAHECFQKLVENGLVDWDAVPEVAQKHGADVEEVRMLCAMASRLWRQVKDSFYGALSELGFASEVAPGVTLTGHVDINAVNGTVARAADWKTGRKDTDYSHQYRAYATLILLDDPTLTEVTVTGIWVRDGDIENYTMTRADARAWLRELQDRVLQWDGVYRTGSHCVWCPRSHECQAARAMFRRDMETVASPDVLARIEGDLSQVSAEEALDIYQKAALVEQFAGKIKASLKRHVEENGDIQTKNYRLTVVSEERRNLDPMLAWPVLDLEGFTDEDKAACMKFSISKVEALVKERAGRGNGARAIRELNGKLQEARAIGVDEIRKLTLKRA